MKNQEHRYLRSLPKLVDLHVKNSMVTYLKISIKSQYRCRPTPNNCNQIWEIQIAPTAHEKCPNQARSDGEEGRGGAVTFFLCLPPTRSPPLGRPRAAAPVHGTALGQAPLPTRCGKQPLLCSQMHRGERLFIFGSSLSSEAKCTLRMRRLLETIVWCYSVPEEPFMRLRGLLHCLLEKALSSRSST